MRRVAGGALICLLTAAGTARGQTLISPTESLTRNLDLLPLVKQELISTLKDSIVTEIAGYPAASSSGAFTYDFDASLGIVKRSTRSFGPAFAERALTLGRRKFSASVTEQHADFDKLEGLSLKGLPLFHGSNDIDLRMTLRADTTLFAFQTGVSPRLDVGVLVPYTRVHMAAGVYVIAGDHSALVGTAGEGSASGLGDVVVKAKYNVHQVASTGLAVSADLSLPTGDEFNFRGAGHARLRLQGVASTEVGIFSPHANAGLTLPLRPLLSHAAFLLSHVAAGPDEFNYSGGVDVIANRAVTVTADLLGRTRRHAFRFGYLPDEDGSGDSSFLPINNGKGTLTQLLSSLGVKLNVRGGTLLTAGVLVPLTHNGLSSRVSGILGLEHDF